MLNNLSYGTYITLRDAVIKHSTKKIVKEAGTNSKDDYERLKRFFKSQLPDAIQFINQQLLQTLDPLYDQAPKIELMDTLSSFEHPGP